MLVHRCYIADGYRHSSNDGPRRARIEYIPNALTSMVTWDSELERQFDEPKS